MFLCIVLIINTLDCSTNNFTVYCVLLFFSLFPYRDNEAEVSHIHRKQITSALKNKVDTKRMFSCTSMDIKFLVIIGNKLWLFRAANSQTFDMRHSLCFCLNKYHATLLAKLWPAFFCIPIVVICCMLACVFVEHKHFSDE